VTNASGDRSERTPTRADGYLDAASSEPLHPAAKEVLLAALDQGYADPRRLHGPGRSARLLLDNAREAVAGALGVRADEVTFTRSGTDAVHRGLLGLLTGRARVGSLLLHTAVEHSSVLHAAHWHPGAATAVSVERTGRVSHDAVTEALETAAEPVAAVACQLANHEVGTLQPVSEIAAAAGDVPVFTDACAAMGRIPLPEGYAVAAGSAHKWGGPAGVGVLVVRKGVRWRDPFPGDDRVDVRTTGFEDVPGALAAAAALQAVVAERDEVGARQRALVDRIRTRVAREVPDVEVVGDPDLRLPHLVTFSCLYVDGEVLVTELDRLGFSVASGSACTSAAFAPSHVLEAMGVLTHGNLRISLTRDTTAETVDRLLAELPGIVAGIRKEAGL